MKTINFYRVSEPYGFFSNFSSHPIFINGEIWATVEHYFQANKFENNEIINRIKMLDSPMKAAIEGRNKNNIIRKDWDFIKDSIMLKGLIAKFTQHPDLKKELLETKDFIIVENTKNDNYWGNGGDNSGRNRLGNLIMDVRKELNRISPDPNTVFPPWIAFPNVSQHDLFWRMGLGEEYLGKWASYYLNCGNKKKYQEYYPENGDWTDIYM